MKEIEKVVEEIGTVKFNPQNGGKSKDLPAKTIYTYYKDGTNDCKLIIQKPLNISDKVEEMKKENK